MAKGDQFRVADKETLDEVYDSVVELYEFQKRSIDAKYKQYVAEAATAAEVDALFVEWWKVNWAEGVTSKNELCSRWFGSVLDDDRVHGVKEPLFATSESYISELTDDSVGLTCVPSTEETAGQDDFARLPQFWCLEVSVEKNEDGTHTIYYVEHIDDIADVRSGEHLCWVLQKNTYTREWIEGGYKYFKMQCHAADGYDTWPQGTDKANNVYTYMANPKYGAGLNSDGIPTCGTGLAPMTFTSHKSAVAAWRERGPQYSGASGDVVMWQLAMIKLKYAVKGNSGTIEGCSNYNYQYEALLTGITGGIYITREQAANLHVGSCVIIGNMDTGDSKDRGAVSMRSICDRKRITDIQDVTNVLINSDGSEDSSIDCAFVEIDNGDTKLSCVAGETYISTMPYYSGWNDNVQGYDGSRYSYTSGKEPGLIQKTEFQNGAYLIVSDELWQWGTDDDGNYILDVYTCHDQSKVTTDGTISSDYTKQEDLTLVFPADTTSGWQYIEDTAISEDKAVLWPAKVSKSAGSGTGVKAGFHVYPASSGVRAAWRVCALNAGGHAGLPACYSNLGVTYALWNGASGAPGLAG